MQPNEPFRRHSAWVLGFVAAFSTGPYPFPVNLQATFVYAAVFVVLWLRVRNHRTRFFDSPHVFLCIGLLLALSFAFTTNTWVLIALYASVVFLGLDFVLRRFSASRRESAGGTFFEAAVLAVSFFRMIFSRNTVTHFLSAPIPGDTGGEGKPPAARRIAVILISTAGGIFLGYIFHLLFASVNEDYARFMDAFMEWLWSVLLKDLLFAIVYSYLWFALFSAERTKPHETQPRKFPVAAAVGVLTAVIVVTGIFSIFQTKLIVVDVPELKFSDLSIYTQKGFLQLVIAILLGYCIVLFAIHTKLRTEARTRLLFALTLIFIGELLLAGAFSAHKLILLQSVFGFKDERILASLGILFIVFSFVLLVSRSFSARADVAGFRYQVWFLLVAVLGINTWSIDSVSSTVHPIRYFKEGKHFEDYSYLLSNSYDNVSEWPRLMMEMQAVDPPRPGPGYFWGHESRGRSDVFGGSYTPLCAEAEVGRNEAGDDEFQTPSPTRNFRTALEKYADRFHVDVKAPRNFRLQTFLDFNVREYTAYSLARLDPREIRNFRSYLVEYCRRSDESSASSRPLVFTGTTDLIPYRKGNKWGFADRSKRIVISPRYSETWPMRGGIARVVFQEKFGFVDVSGKEIVPPRYDGADDLIDGLARVYAHGKWGYIDAAGAEVVPLSYDLAGPSRGGAALVKQNGAWGLVDSAGRQVVPLRYTSIDFAFVEDTARVTLGDRYGFIDQKGTEIIATKYEFARPFREGLAAFRNKKWGFVNRAGVEVIGAAYDGAGDFRDGLAPVSRAGKWGYIDLTGREVIPFRYDGAADFSEGRALVLIQGKRGFIDKRGVEMGPVVYDAAGSFSEGRARVRLRGTTGYVDAAGRLTIKAEYRDAGDFRDGLAWADSVGGGLGFLEKDGRAVVPFLYDRVEAFREGLARVESGGKSGYVDQTGRVVIPLLYSYAGNFIGGIARVTRNAASGYIDRNGVEFWEDAQ